MEKIFLNVLNLSITASYMIIAVIVARFLLKKVPKSICCFLWFLVGLRLIFPFSIESVFSLIPKQTEIQDKLVSYVESEMSVYNLPQSDTSYVLDMPSSTFDEDIHKSIESNISTTSILNIISKIWVAGIVLLIIYLIFSWQRLKGKVRTAVPRMYKGIKYYQCDNISSPFLFGLINPKIYIPSVLCTSSTDDELLLDKTDTVRNHLINELDYVLKHEIAHKSRKDYIIKPIGYLLLTVYWFNPFVWIAYLMLCRDIELACDECVIKELGNDFKRDYSQALLSCSVNRRIISACPVAFGEIGVKQRIKNVLNYRKPTFWAVIISIMVCIIIVLCFMTQKKLEHSEIEVNNSENVSIARILVELSPIFKIDLPEELYQKLKFEVLNDLEVVVKTVDEKYGIGKLCVMPANDIIETMTYNEFCLIGNYGANGVLREYYESFEINKSDNIDLKYSSIAGIENEIEFPNVTGIETGIENEVELPNITDIEAKLEGMILLPNADGTDIPEVLPNAGSEYNADYINGLDKISAEKSNDISLKTSQFCYIFIPYSNWNIEDEAELTELVKLQEEFLTHLTDVEITEAIISRFDEYYKITDTDLYTGSIEDAIIENLQIIEIEKKRIEDCIDEGEKLVYEQLLKDLEAKNVYLLNQLENMIQ